MESINERLDPSDVQATGSALDPDPTAGREDARRDATAHPSTQETRPSAGATMPKTYENTLITEALRHTSETHRLTSVTIEDDGHPVAVLELWWTNADGGRVLLTRLPAEVDSFAASAVTFYAFNHRLEALRELTEHPIDPTPVSALDVEAEALWSDLFG